MEYSETGGSGVRARKKICTSEARKPFFWYGSRWKPISAIHKSNIAEKNAIITEKKVRKNALALWKAAKLATASECGAGAQRERQWRSGNASGAAGTPEKKLGN